VKARGAAADYSCNIGDRDHHRAEQMSFFGPALVALQGSARKNIMLCTDIKKI